MSRKVFRPEMVECLSKSDGGQDEREEEHAKEGDMAEGAEPWVDRDRNRSIAAGDWSLRRRIAEAFTDSDAGPGSKPCRQSV